MAMSLGDLSGDLTNCPIGGGPCIDGSAPDPVTEPPVVEGPKSCQSPYVKDGKGGCILGSTFCTQQYVGMVYDPVQNFCVCQPGHIEQSHGICVSDMCVAPYVKDGKGGCIHGEIFCFNQYTGMVYNQAQNRCVCENGYTEQSHGYCVPPEEEPIPQPVVCQPGYMIYTESVGCEKIYCGEHATYNLAADDCFCDYEYIRDDHDNCVFIEEDYDEIPMGDPEGAAQNKPEVNIPTPAPPIIDVKPIVPARPPSNTNRGASVEKNEITDLVEQAEIAAEIIGKEVLLLQNFGPLETTQKLRRINGNKSETFISSELAKKIATDTRANMPNAAQKTLRDIENLLQSSTISQTSVPDIITKLKSDKQTSTTGRILADLYKKFSEDEEDDGPKSDLDVFTTAVGDFASNLKDQGVLGDKKASIIEKLTKGEGKDLLLGFIRDGLDKYSKKGGTLQKFTKKTMEFVDKIESVSGKLNQGKEVFEKYSKKYKDLKEKVERVIEIGKDVKSARTELGGAAGSVQIGFIAMREIGSEVVDKVLGNTIENLPLGGLEKVPGDAAKLLLKIPAEIGKSVTVLHQKNIKKLEQTGLGYEYSYNSDLRRFLDQKTDHKLEGTKGNKRTIKTLDYDLDGKTQSVKYNLNADSFVQEVGKDGKPTGFIVATPCEGCLDLKGNVRFKVKDNTWLMGFGGSMEMELWTNEDPPRKIKSIPYK